MLAVLLRGKKKGIEKETLFFVREILKKREKLEDFHTLCQEMQINDTLIPPPSPLTPPPKKKKRKERKKASYVILKEKLILAVKLMGLTCLHLTCA